MSALLREIAGTPDLLALAAAWPERYPGLLESVARGSARARHDILFAFPGERLVLAVDGLLECGGVRSAGDFLQALDARWRQVRLAGDASSQLPFRGGWLLYLGYELAAQIEPSLQLPQPVQAVPRALALRCPAAIIVDHARGCSTLVAEAGHGDLLDLMSDDLARVKAYLPQAIRLEGIDEDPAERFVEGVARVHEHLRRGDVFQVNLSRAWRARLTAPTSAADCHAALCRANPAPFAGLLQVDDWAIASSSPERLLELRGRLAQTRPIAGTRARQAGDDDAARRAELVGHPKERAEHVMLIDLERNDLGRVCEPGSVVVDELMAIESYAHVHHIVSNVRGRLRDEVTPGEAIRAVFPGGTITGCPKVRCMQIIAALEGVGRGAYTGSLGYLNRDGDLDLNILIRTLCLQGKRIEFRAGAGIVADSDALRELEETRAKARGMLAALRCAG
ncbi:aminodeoxychorismate synthase component I [Dokdonella sp.]|uniref:aminodeoxychorismate synthase component I n=1 Tax=Dokdonella sp. TaxID=2291710 RepID=UPI0025C5954E|nr:aminodeoxychorismate synthase component I [Dokdonella sp.]MBX3688131.1 aminodeoxychorismate synthase component I [Dokdonella sp.]